MITRNPFTPMEFLQTRALVGPLVSLAIFAGASANAAPVISEFLADNETGLRDADGDYSDWIEIFNPDSVAVDLGGYYLTADAGDLSYVVEISGNLVLWQDGAAFTVEAGSSQDNGAGTETVTVRSLQPVGAQSAQYLRLRVHLPL